MDERFRSWPTLSDPNLAAAVGVSQRHRLQLLHEGAEYDPLATLLKGDTLQARLSRALVARRAIDRKEFFETWEFFARTRSSLKPSAADGGGMLVDVAGGHGLAAVLFAVFEWQRFRRVLVLDTRKPKAADDIFSAAAEVAPWVASRLEYISGEQADLRGAGARQLTNGCAVACVHGCNDLTDAVLAAADERGAASVAVMPCCYGGVAKASPPALRRSLGVALAADIERTYWLEERDWDVKWRAIPKAISPMNRIVLARRRAPTSR